MSSTGSLNGANMTGQIECAVDRKFADEGSKYRAFQKECRALQEDSTTYGDSMRAMTSAQARFAQTIESFYNALGRTSDDAMADHAFGSTGDHSETSIQRETEALYHTCIMDPLEKMNACFSVVNEHISKRNRRLFDCDAARSKLGKLTDKPSEDPTKLSKAQQEHDETKEVVRLPNEQLILQLLDLRVPYFDPSFEAMIRMQCKFAEDGYEKMSMVQRYFPENVRDDDAGQLDAQVESVLRDMKELSICGTESLA